MRCERGQAAILLLGAMAVLIALAAVFAAFGEAFGARGRAQRVADLAAVSGARRMRDLYAGLFEPARLPSGDSNPAHIERSRYLALARESALRAAERNGFALASRDVTFPDGSSFTIILSQR